MHREEWRGKCSVSHGERKRTKFKDTLMTKRRNGLGRAILWGEQTTDEADNEMATKKLQKKPGQVEN